MSKAKINRAERDARHAEAFRKMEGSICDLKYQSQILSHLVWSFLMEQSPQGLTMEEVACVNFATLQLQQSIKTVERQYYSDHEGASHA